MPLMTELDVINDQLATLGESPLNSIEDDHPMVAAGLRFLRVASYREQAKGWWFNKELVTLTPDPVTGKVLVPADAITVDPEAPYNHYVQRGRYMYDPRKSSTKFSEPIPTRLTRNIPFEDLPPTAAAYIGVSAVLAFQRSYDADPQKTADLKQDLARALIDLNAEHTRSINANLLNNPSVQAKVFSLGSTLAFGGLRR